MKRPMGYTYRFLKEKLGDPEQLTLRKQMCLQYFRWGFTGNRDERDKFVELAKRWRKEEARVGLGRTLLEKKAREFFQDTSKRKRLAPSREGAKEWGYKTKEEGIGVHSPEYKAKLREHNIRIRKIQTEKNLEPSSKHWIVYDPDGEVYHIYNLARFCRENGLDENCMLNTNLNPNRTHKGGWRAECVDPDWKPKKKKDG